MFKIVMSMLVIMNIYAKESSMQFFLIEVNQNSNMKIKVNDISIFDSKKGQPNGRYILNNYLNNGNNELNITIYSDCEIKKLSEVLNKLHLYISNSKDLNKIDKVIYKLSKDDLVIFKEKNNDKFIYTFSIELMVNKFFTWRFKESEKIELDNKNKMKIFIKIEDLRKKLLNKDITEIQKLFSLKNKENAEGTYRDVKIVESNINNMFNRVFDGKNFKVAKIASEDNVTFIFEANRHIVEVKLNEKFPLMISSDDGRMGIPLRFIKENNEFYFYK